MIEDDQLCPGFQKSALSLPCIRRFLKVWQPHNNKRLPSQSAERQPHLFNAHFLEMPR